MYLWLVLSKNSEKSLLIVGILEATEEKSRIRCYRSGTLLSFIYVPQPRCRQPSFLNYVRLYSLVLPPPSLPLFAWLKPTREPGGGGGGALETSVHCIGHMYRPVMAATVPQVNNK
jgi:hypothetical protein